MSDRGRRASEATAPTGGPIRGPARAILVVADDAGVRESVASALVGRGHDVITATSGREALRAVYTTSATPALLVSDIDLPAMSGIELAARVSAERPGIRVVLMTARPDSADLARGRPSLVAGVLLKPFSLDDLLDAVDAALAVPRG